MKISISPSENYSRSDVENLMSELKEVSEHVEFGGTYQRRSVEDLPPLVLLILVEVTGGFLEAVGADVWDQLKGVTKKVLATTRGGQRPEVFHVIESDQGDSQLRNLDYDGYIDEQLDSALARLIEIGKPTNLWYAKETGKWETYEERLTKSIKESRGRPQAGEEE